MVGASFPEEDVGEDVETAAWPVVERRGRQVGEGRAGGEAVDRGAGGGVRFLGALFMFKGMW